MRKSGLICCVHCRHYICYMKYSRDLCYMHDMRCMHMKCVAYYTNVTYTYIQNMNMACNAYAMSTLHILYMHAWYIVQYLM